MVLRALVISLKLNKTLGTSNSNYSSAFLVVFFLAVVLRRVVVFLVVVVLFLLVLVFGAGVASGSDSLIVVRAFGNLCSGS